MVIIINDNVSAMKNPGRIVTGVSFAALSAIRIYVQTFENAACIHVSCRLAECQSLVSRLAEVFARKLRNIESKV